VTEVKMVGRRVKAVRAIRRSTELEGSDSYAATRADQVAYGAGTSRQRSSVPACAAGTTSSRGANLATVNELFSRR
jgi:hypothetical protein